ncbi:3,4-dihydroxy-2-butanone-4-phosphate synthase [Seleniivibrio woodruffii]|uniref:3,4-dihydroxy-2-butanone 4-phosphate synthase n=1 Tax=Seleniivibrio woodruffii TaxID=1078050 RepID=A0A4R1K9J9_9BACT|nr:3,4-dihydroxy-2-butanone-4-phosphate synthase [Seleniivibrio woodruffii]TCK61066.1 3,4-dihydroxy-2-butanone 4-phosphate synthase [Seleniivibrio woodruffii]TVZ36694.1 3,4-dihydroxy 2-butanone 4-phosphate synthase [Seleniivibrio woodruffii]
MNQKTLSIFGNSTERMEKAIAALKAGEGIIVVDDENRENEGDLIYPAESLTSAQMARLIRDCSGIVCVCITEEKRKELGLEMMSRNNRSQFGTAFTVSVEAAEGVTTGVSASDRVTTVHAVLNGADLASPGHVFPLVAREGGVHERDGHTEATVDMMKLAGYQPCGVLCELTNPDGTMMKLPQILEYAEQNSFTVISIEDIKEYIGVHA